MAKLRTFFGMGYFTVKGRNTQLSCMMSGTSLSKVAVVMGTTPPYVSAGTDRVLAMDNPNKLFVELKEFSGDWIPYEDIK